MAKKAGAFLTIGELAEQLNVAQHILRYWETRFPQLRPLQRAGNRRYYRPADVELAKRIHHLLYVEGFTVRGAQQALGSRKGKAAVIVSDEPESADSMEVAVRVAPAPTHDTDQLIDRLERIRSKLATLLDDEQLSRTSAKTAA